MKNILIGMSFIALVAIVAYDSRQDRKYPRLKPTLPVSSGFWVEVGMSEAKHNCFVEYRREADYQVLKRDNHNLRIRYKNIFPTGLGTLCTDNTEFTVSAQEFGQKMLAREEYLKYRLQIDAMAEIARQRGGRRLGVVEVETVPGWVTIANIGGIKNSAGTRSDFGESCTLADLPGTFDVLVDAGRKYVVRFNGRGGEGTQCPDGTMFFAVEK